MSADAKGARFDKKRKTLHEDGKWTCPSEENIGIRVSCQLVADLKRLLGYSPDLPANFSVDMALRELKDRLEKEKTSIAEK